MFTYIYIEIFYTLIFFSVFRGLKYFSSNMTKKLNYFIFKKNIFLISINLILVYVLTLKMDYMDNSILSLLLIYILVINLMSLFINTNFYFILFNIFYFLFLILFINSLIIFFLFIELYSILFYFFFLNNENNSSLSLLKLKNSLLLYLINNSITTVLFLVGIFYVVEFYGTVNFTELSYLTGTGTEWQLYTLVIAFMIKLALPTVHYLKLEIYKYLTVDTVIMFSVITVLLNFILTIFFLSHNFVFILMAYYKLFNLLIILSFFFFIQKLKVNNFQEFVAYSGFATNNLIILALIV